MNVLIVDDSVVFRTQISGALGKHPEIHIAGTAANGSIALQKLTQLSIDVVTLDMEMPDMSGLDVLREIRKRSIAVRVIIFSSQTPRGAEAALLALREGADDVVPKPNGESLSLETAGAAIEEALIPKVLQFKQGVRKQETPSKIQASERPAEAGSKPSKKKDLTRFSPSAIVIGSSTGGPSALEKIFRGFSAPLEIPILIVQHMPPVFTESLAKRIQDISGVPASEAKDGERVLSNHIYVAPGDYHMLVERKDSNLNIVLNRLPQRNSVRPAVDYLFETSAQCFGSSCLGIVLTGMGEDGLLGAKAIRNHGGGIMIQDKDSCVVFGMPGAIFEADEYDQIGNLDLVSNLIRRLTSKREMQT